ncbi:uncharacterized protein N7529_002357 [Penicillium soppii]|uniref:uncharacterized protein n=1 Tax=Penicillium soppii TaxID=69789 RepID=UPI002546E9AE|nr:uncharacterized protein N7529_002357 [Penicillium soppii]KAJ5873927.1 hypothetical protein N7529_002357 [Penicillium soppii]
MSAPMTAYLPELGFSKLSHASYAVALFYRPPDTGYIAMAELCDKIRDVSRQVSCSSWRMVIPDAEAQ